MQPAGRVQRFAASSPRFVELGRRWTTLFSCGDSTSGKSGKPINVGLSESSWGRTAVFLGTFAWFGQIVQMVGQEGWIEALADDGCLSRLRSVHCLLTLVLSGRVVARVESWQEIGCWCGPCSGRGSSAHVVRGGVVSGDGQ